MDKGIKISPKYYEKDWKDLDLNRQNINDWNKAIEIFQDRIEGRYFKQIEALDNNKDRSIGTFSGFAIMSLTCLLIETLEQFWQGNITTKKVTNTNFNLSWLNFFKKKIKREIKGDALAFHSFFQRSERFKVFFNTPEKTNIFYIKIRCGLLHQGQTKGKSLIHIRNSEPLLKWNSLTDINQGISINRQKFVAEVRIVYEKFIADLKTRDLNFKKSTLKRKMDYIISEK